MSNLYRLYKAGLVDPTKLSPEEQALADSLTDEEVDALISIKGKQELRLKAPLSATCKII